MAKIKICGLTREVDIESANRLQPEYIGFVFSKNSRRYVTHSRAKELKDGLKEGILAVGVFVNAPVEEIAPLCLENVIDVVQLHGQEEESYIKELRQCIDKPMIKAFSIGSLKDIHKANASTADYVLLDNGAGGTGETFDWSLLSNLTRPYFLAGGLNPENIEEALNKISPLPYAVDTSSGVETEGVKDHRKIEEFIRLVRERMVE